MKDSTSRFVTQSVGFGSSGVSVLFGFLAGLGSIASSFYFIAIVLVLTAVSIPLVRYNDVFVEEVEHFMRGVLYPLYRDKIRPIINYIRRIHNPIVCWFNALNWWSYGMLIDVIWPTFSECGPGLIFENLGKFILAVFEDFVVNYFLAQRFYDGPCDFTNICNKFIAFWDSWLALSACTCSDMAILLQSLPIIPSPLFSKQWSDPQTWSFVANVTNAVMELLAIVLRLVVQLLHAILLLIDPQSPYASANFTRPNFYRFFDLLCSAGSSFVRSFENAIQLFWSKFVPFKFVFHDYFCILDTAFCFILKTVNWLLTFLINIDLIVQYPVHPQWETLMKPLTVEGLNILGPLTPWATITLPVPLPRGNVLMTNYALDTRSSAYDHTRGLFDQTA